MQVTKQPQIMKNVLKLPARCLRNRVKKNALAIKQRFTSQLTNQLLHIQSRPILPLQWHLPLDSLRVELEFKNRNQTIWQTTTEMILRKSKKTSQKEAMMIQICLVDLETTLEAITEETNSRINSIEAPLSHRVRKASLSVSHWVLTQVLTHLPWRTTII